MYNSPREPGTMQATATADKVRTARAPRVLIADELSARIDFVIAGARPAVLRLSKNPSPENQAVHDDQNRKKDAYSGAINDAQALSIPIFTQETFLQFMGRVR